MFIIKDFLSRVEEFKEFIKDIIYFDEDGDFFHNLFYSISNKIQLYISGNFNGLYNAWTLLYDFYPNWVLSITGLTLLLGPYVIWVTTNILILMILFVWYFTIFSYNYLSDTKFDIFLKKIILNIIIKFKYIISLLNIFKFNYYFLFNLLIFFTNYLNYTKNSKYHYDMYGNSLILIKKSFINFFRNILYINLYLDSFYYQTTLKLDWRSILTFHIDERELEDPEDFEQIILWPLHNFNYKSYLLKVYDYINKYSIFDRFSKRRRLNFFYSIKESFIFYIIINLKNFFILLFIISFFNIILLNIFIKILKYITSF